MTEPLSPEEEAVLRRGAWATSAWPEVMPRIWATLDAARAPLPDSDLAGLLRSEGWEPEFNVCATCGHDGGDHDLGNWCLVCPRPDYVSKGKAFSDRIDAGWDYFASFTEAALWERAVSRLAARGVSVAPPALAAAPTPAIDRERLARAVFESERPGDWPTWEDYIGAFGTPGIAPWTRKADRILAALSPAPRE